MNILDNSILNEVPEYLGDGGMLSESDEAMMLYYLIGKYNSMCDEAHPDRDSIVNESDLYNLLRARLEEIAGKEATEYLCAGFHMIQDELEKKLTQSTPLDCAEVGAVTGDANRPRFLLSWR